MRTRYLLLIIVVPLVALLALGAIPSLLGGGDISYIVATETELEDETGEPPAENVSETLNFDDFSENRFPYTVSALEADDGVSDPYEAGRFGFEEFFTHTPFDEFDEFRSWEPAAADGDTVWIEHNGSYYRLEITDEANV